jgi:oligopeptide transport system permease protein
MPPTSKDLDWDGGGADDKMGDWSSIFPRSYVFDGDLASIFRSVAPMGKVHSLPNGENLAGGSENFMGNGSVVWAIFRKLPGSIFILWAVVTITFAMLRAVPGGPFDCERELPPQAQSAIRAHYDPETPVFRQYLQYLSRILHGDLGPSYRHGGWTVNELLADKLAASCELGCYSLLLATAVGVGWGCRSALGDFRSSSSSSPIFSTVLLCVPTFVLGPLLGYIFSQKLHWLSAMGWHCIRDKILPTVTLATFHGAFIGRLTRQSMLAEFSRSYVRTALAKGLSLRQTFRRHIFPNGIQPVIAYLGPTCSGVLSGTFVVENVFHIPGLGRLFVESIGNRDYTVVTGVVFVYAVLIILCNLLADTMISFLNPRIGGRP